MSAPQQAALGRVVSATLLLSVPFTALAAGDLLLVFAFGGLGPEIKRFSGEGFVAWSCTILPGSLAVCVVALRLRRAMLRSHLREDP